MANNQESSNQDEVPRMRKYPHSGVLYKSNSTHPLAPFLQGPATIFGCPGRVKIFQNRGKGKTGEDVITLIFEPKEEGK